MATGKVKWFDQKKGYGFLTDPEVESEVFVHFREIQTEGFKSLQEGEHVKYELSQDRKGPRAKKVQLIQS